MVIHIRSSSNTDPPSRTILTFVSNEMAIDRSFEQLDGLIGGDISRAMYAIKGSRAALRCTLTPGGDTGKPSFDRFVWTKDGRPIDGQTSAVLTIPSVSVGAQGNYTCAAANAIATGPSARLHLLAKGKKK